MIRYITKNPKILFAGINPHPGSHDRGVPFSNNKLFWYLLSRASLIDETIVDLRDDAKLRKVYKEKFNKVYGLGFINIIDRPTRDITGIKKGEELPGRKKISHIIQKEKPKIVCFIGKVAYEKYVGSKDFTFGWQKSIDASKVFVMHFPLRGEAIIRVRELQKIKRALKNI
ncbi:MAG: mismatch-specific DNA-glycosylase [Ilumatobacteraceae bacterium]